MLEYDKINLTKAIHVNKVNGWRYCIICHNWYPLEINFRFQAKVCNEATIVCVIGNSYRIPFLYASKD